MSLFECSLLSQHNANCAFALDTAPAGPVAWHPWSSHVDRSGGSRFSLQLASVSHEKQPSRLRWFRKPFSTAGNSRRHTGCDLINTALYFRFLLNVTAAAAALLMCPRWGAAAWLCPAQASLVAGLPATAALAGAGTGCSRAPAPGGRDARD